MIDSPFTVLEKCPATHARLGKLVLPHAEVETPVFMPVGTQATVKTMDPRELLAIGFKLILGNTYHLNLRPGSDRIKRLGGLHEFMRWPRGILTDSGGYQVFSLREFNSISEEGTTFKSYLDGTKIHLTPEVAIGIQDELGSDVVMAFDECIPYPSDEAYTREATYRSFRWTKRSSEEFRRRISDGRLFFGIVQGGMYPHLRDESSAMIEELNPAGIAIGGLSVGEPKAMCREILAHTAPKLEPRKPRYLMGVGTPLDIAKAVANGVDMFDCVMPTRVGRHGHVYTWSEGKLNLLNKRFTEDRNPLDPSCRCSTCSEFSRAYLSHLFRTQETLGARLATLHNLAYYHELMVRIRAAIPRGELPGFIRQLEEQYPEKT